ncbi:major facilitator superfamily domain-containing protein 3-like [Anneissia japonica]|uniref:major facilitator superfamily domain-containing protein 3-like n=1 Tax=Anneissia japonica TaxID=1529436 RepID=UPI00142590A5|nr:major facilitator superfamily domain-containing protein 3-like [Anneissia japonica]
MAYLSTKALDWFNYKNFLFLFLLYFVQGIPYGLQARFLPIFLRSTGTSLARIGLLKLLLLPWLLKILWAPLFDWMQSKRKWLLMSMVGLFCVCCLGSCIKLDNISYLCAILLFLNIFSSTQDIAVDGLAIQLLTDKQVGLGNTIQVVGYKFGSIFGGGVLMWLSTYLPLSGLFLFLSFLYLFSIFCIFLFNMDETRTSLSRTMEPNGSLSPVDNYKPHYNGETHYKRLSKSDEHNQSYQVHDVQVGHVISKQNPLFWLKKLIYLPGTFWIIILVIVYKLGEQGCVDQFPLYLVDRGVPAPTVGFWSGVVCQGLSIIGSLLGGLYLSKFWISPLSLLNMLFYFRLIPMVLEFLHVIHIISSDISGFIAMCSLQLIGGAITTTMFTLMMQCSQKAPVEVQGTHYTLLATLEVMGKLLFVAGVGWLSDSLGYSFMFCMFIIISVLAVTFVRFLENGNYLIKH